MITDTGKRMCDAKIWSTKRQLWTGCRCEAVQSVPSTWRYGVKLDFCERHKRSAEFIANARNDSELSRHKPVA
jgi:hypothetical protein